MRGPAADGAAALARGQCPDGHASVREASSAIIEFDDGTQARIGLTWISEPIDAGFFVYGVPPANWKPGRLATVLRYVVGEGNPVGTLHRVGLDGYYNGSLRDVTHERRHAVGATAAPACSRQTSLGGPAALSSVDQ